MKRSRNGSFKGKLAKSPSGIRGLDEITGGGLPTGRPTLICGSAGCGKTLMGVEFLVRGAAQFNEPGVFMAFEETPEEVTQNVAAMGFDLGKMVAQKKLALDYVHLERSEIEETGEYDLEGLFIRLGHAIGSVGAKRVVLDTIETLFVGLPNPGIVRAELRRLFRWLKDRGVTAIVTGERGDGILTRNGLEEYVSDCVILLDHRVINQMSTRRLCVVKYRGTSHGTNEYPFLIDQDGISVWPVTSLRLDHPVSSERIPSGVARMDTMLGGEGYYRGSSILVSGSAGTGKSSMAAHFADATCRSGERCLYFDFEESPYQVIRNMNSIGLDLEQWVRRGRLRFLAARPFFYGLEMHLARMIKAATEWEPHVVIIDPITALGGIADPAEVKTMLIRFVDFLKTRGTTVMLINLTHDGGALEHTDAGMSSLVDTWLVLRDIELNGERNRGLYVLKSRGMAHSNQIREFRLTPKGIELTDVCVGPNGVLTGSARLAQEAREKAEHIAREQEIERQRQVLDRKRQMMESQIAAMRAEFAVEEAEVKKRIDQQQLSEERLRLDKKEMARSRQTGSVPEKAQVRENLNSKKA